VERAPGRARIAFAVAGQAKTERSPSREEKRVDGPVVCDRVGANLPRPARLSFGCVSLLARLRVRATMKAPAYGSWEMLPWQSRYSNYGVKSTSS
jgi:hypothetical protein